MLEIWLLFLPAISAAICGLSLLNCNKRYSEIFATGTMLLTASLSWVIFIKLFLKNVDPYTLKISTFLEFSNVVANWEIKIDRLSSLMLVIVTNVSAVVHFYSIGYMASDKSQTRFMSYLSLFTFFMLVLVVSGNLLQLFVGWEGVGLSSYLLIGFWYNKNSANLAAKKAFIVNRVGDLFLLIGIIAIYCHFGSFAFEDIMNKINIIELDYVSVLGFKASILEFIGVLLFLGAMGKSAQIGLHVWLPDAMEGPTPVSALIHAATMVTAGIFLVSRFSFLYDQTIIARELITYVGVITALFGATVAIVQTDIKKIIAYSTCSQLGYMFFACGVGAYNAGMFHLLTHAFFKALLFLSAGSVIHGLSGEQNIFKMGKLYNKMPISFICFLIGTVAIAGFYPFSGFYSKDAILESAFASQTSFGNFAYYIGVIVAFLTSFYSWRLIIVVFGGERKYSEDIIPHESPKIMLLPMILLTLGAIFSGIILYRMGIVDANSKFWLNSISVDVIKAQYLDMHDLPFMIKYLPLIASILGLMTSCFTYIFLKPTFLKNLKNIFYKLYKFLFNKWYFDEFYEVIFIKNLQILSNKISDLIERKIIDGLGPMGLVKVINLLSIRLRAFHSGYIYDYALVLFAGTVIILSWFIWLKLY